MCRDRVWVLMRYIKKYEFTSEEIVAVGSRYHMEDMVVCVMDKLHSIFPMEAVLLPVLEGGHIGLIQKEDILRTTEQLGDLQDVRQLFYLFKDDTRDNGHERYGDFQDMGRGINGTKTADGGCEFTVRFPYRDLELNASVFIACGIEVKEKVEENIYYIIHSNYDYKNTFEVPLFLNASFRERKQE